MAGNIFISYRRDDAAAWAGRLHMALERHFRRDQIFMDVDSIEAGLDFAKVIDAEVAKCDVMLVVIGKDWLDVRDASGRRRLDNPGDFVRLEVERALRRDIRVVPVLVDGASLPKAEELPAGMQGLVRRQAWELRHSSFAAQANELAREIGGRAFSSEATLSLSSSDIIEVAKAILYIMAGVGAYYALVYVTIGTINWFAVALDFENPNYHFWGAMSFLTCLALLLLNPRWLSEPQILGLFAAASMFFIPAGLWFYIQLGFKLDPVRDNSLGFYWWGIFPFLAIGVPIILLIRRRQ